MHADSFHDEDSGMSSTQLFHILYQKKQFIIFATLFSLAIGLAYIFFTPSIYMASANISAPTEGNVAAFNKGRLWGDSGTIKPMDIMSVYTVFNDELLSLSIKKYFFKQYYLPHLQKQPKDKVSLKRDYDFFSKQLSIKINKTVRPVQYEISMKSPNPELAANWVKQFVNLVKERTLKVLFNDIEQQRNVIVYNLQNQINTASKVATATRMDHINQLREALKIAQFASIDTPLSTQYSSVNESNMAYMLGTKVLQAKIKNLTERLSDDSFTPTLRDLQSKLDFYKSFAINPKDVAVFYPDGTVETPVTPVSPKKGLILFASLILGLIIGTFGVIINYSVKINKGSPV